MKSLFFCILVLLILISGVNAQDQKADIPFNDSIAGDRNLGQLYSWTINNASGRASSVYHYTVYDYRLLGDNLTYFSVNWGTWQKQQTETPGKKYLIVWLRGWTEGTSWYGWDAGRFPLSIWGNTTIYPDPVLLQDLSVRYGSERRLPAVIREVENRTATTERGLLTTERYGWKDNEEYNRIEPGRSNAFDGYLVYQIPDPAQPEDILVVGWFGYWGSPVWHLTPTEIDQDSIEKKLQEESELMKLQIENGIRLSDRQVAERVMG